jgi:DNA-binding beta-propeller fold protein YncE
MTMGAALAEAQPFAYVANGNGNSVSVIDTDPASATFDTVVAIIPVGFSPSSPIGVAITPDGKRAYVTLGSDNAVK